MKPEEWLSAFAAALGVAPPDAGTVEQLLEIAGVAARASERIAAPVACYLIGISGSDLPAAAAAACAVQRQGP
ncbi:MAG: DUF6457 domain-containing protein [Dehalococcoidia bacterium]